MSVYKKHPIFINYFGDEKGNIKKSDLSSIRYCTIKSLHDYKCKKYIYEIGIIINYCDRCEIIYPVTKFTWECFHGLIPSNKIVILKQKNKRKSINNLMCIDYKYISCKCKEKSTIIKDFKSKTIAELKN